MPFDATGRMATAIPFAFEDYLVLVDGTGRAIREDKRGFILGETPAILERLNIDPEQFIRTAGRTLHRFGSAIGKPEHRTERCVSRNVAYLRGIRATRDDGGIMLDDLRAEPEAIFKGPCLGLGLPFRRPAARFDLPGPSGLESHWNPPHHGSA